MESCAWLIPTERNLLVHLVPVPDICPLCKMQGDSTIHALFKCLLVKGYWKESYFKYLLNPIKQQDTFQVIDSLMTSLQKREFAELAMRCWAIWSLRLRTIQKNRDEVVQQRVLWSSNYLREYQRTLSFMKMVGENEPATSSEIGAPRRLAFFPDVDASYNEDSHSYIVGGVVRNHDCNMLLAFGHNILKSLSVHGELSVICEGLNKYVRKYSRIFMLWLTLFCLCKQSPT